MNKHIREQKVKLKASNQVLLPLISPHHCTGSETPPEEILPIPIWQPFRGKPIDECIANISCEGNCIHKACSKTQPQKPSEPKVICCVYKE